MAVEYRDWSLCQAYIEILSKVNHRKYGIKHPRGFQ